MKYELNMMIKILHNPKNSLETPIAHIAEKQVYSSKIYCMKPEDGNQCQIEENQSQNK